MAPSHLIGTILLLIILTPFTMLPERESLTVYRLLAMFAFAYCAALLAEHSSFSTAALPHAGFAKIRTTRVRAGVIMQVRWITNRVAGRLLSALGFLLNFWSELPGPRHPRAEISLLTGLAPSS